MKVKLDDMRRDVEPEWLDILPADDPRAQRSRRDLQRVNAWMRQPQILSRLLVRVFRPPSPCTVVDLGGGDGLLMLRVARRLAWPQVRLLLIDRHNLLTQETRQAFAALRWSVDVVVTDILDWLSKQPDQPIDVMVANLVLHHFADHALETCLQHIAKRTRIFVACEPRRALRAMIGAQLLGLIGCHEISRHDARVSVRAGFADQELSALWPLPTPYRLEEYAAGLFSHCFVAQRA